MLQQSITRTFWHYSIPAIAALLISGLYQIVDGAFIGHAMGAEGLSAINMAWPLSGVLLAVGMMIGMGSGARCSLAQGEEKIDKARRILMQVFWLLIAMGISVGLCIVYFAPMFMRLQDASGVIENYGIDYLTIIGISGPIVLGSIAMPLLVRNLGAPRLATIAMLTGALLNVLMDYVFIIRLGWGLKGAAIGTIISESVAVIICTGFVFSRYNKLRPQREHIAFNLRLSVESLTTGFSSMLMYLYLSVVVMMHNLLFMKHGGPIEVAAYGIASYLIGFYYLLAEGVCGGMQPLVSYYYGARQPDKVRQVLKLGLMTAVGGGIALAVAILILPSLFTSIFISGDSALHVATIHGLRLHLFVMYLDGFIVLAATFFQALGHARYATFITLSNMLILFPFLGFFPWIFGLDGVWLAMPLSNICLSIVVVLMLKRQLRRLGIRLTPKKESLAS
ncbi:MAG: MATE family efflux transporter [Hafnia alvei]|uniref:MATE family efflux transporter n=1 Tax=Hafnia TaxID=568 RepID=UPI001033E009|nr:MATE family efflux transporter [Hafnia alvei]TBL38538.1 MATE family efflux transporter [Hafnia alvei]TBL92868.1 MATE family efflux transporter [Hafnia alvei]